MRTRELLKILLIVTSLSLAGCGGGGGGGDAPPPDNNPGGNNPGGSNPGNTPADTTPEKITLDNVTALPGEPVTLPAFTVAGINRSIPLKVSATDGAIQYSLNGGKDFFNDVREVQNGEKIVLRVSAPAAFGQSASATVSLGETRIAFTVNTPDEPAPLELSDAAHQSLEFVWGNVPPGLIDHFRVLANPGGTTGFDTTIMDGIDKEATSIHVDVKAWEAMWAGTAYLLEGCNADDYCVSWPGQPVLDENAFVVAYLKRPTPVANEGFGGALGGAYPMNSLALSPDGKDLFVGARVAAQRQGMVERFQRGADGTWQHVESIAPPTTDATAGEFGGALRMSRDGEWLFVGEPRATGNRGAVHVYRQVGDAWEFQTGKSLNFALESSRFGEEIATNADGSVLVVAAPQSTSSSVSEAGIVNVYRRDADGEYQLDERLSLGADATSADRFGNALAINAEGTLVAVGVSHHDTNASDLAGNGIPNSGLVVVYRYDGAEWQLDHAIRAAERAQDDMFGYDIALDDSEQLYVGSLLRKKVEIFDGKNGWQLNGELLPMENLAAATFGQRITVSPAGDTVVVAAPGDAAIGDTFPIMLPEAVTLSGSSAGSVQVFNRVDARWQVRAYLAGIDNDEIELFGKSLAISADGRTIAVGAPLEDGNGIDGPENNDIENSGAVFVY